MKYRIFRNGDYHRLEFFYDGMWWKFDGFHMEAHPSHIKAPSDWMFSKPHILLKSFNKFITNGTWDAEFWVPGEEVEEGELQNC